MTDAELEEREVAAELFELRRRVVLDRQDPDQVADDYERTLLETPAPSFAHWEALRRLRDSLAREREDERSRLLLRRADPPHPEQPKRGPGGGLGRRRGGAGLGGGAGPGAGEPARPVLISAVRA